MKTVSVLSHQPRDEFYFALFNQMVELMPDNSRCYYFWSDEPQYDFLETQTFFDWALVFFTDSMQITEYNYRTQIQAQWTNQMQRIADANPKTKFILVTMMDYLDKEITSPNVYTICVGSMQIQQTEYSQMTPVLNKNFDSTTTYISLNRAVRNHRLTNVCYLLGLGLGKLGHISFDYTLIQNINSWLDQVNWLLTTEQHIIYNNYIEPGFEKLRNGAEVVGISNETQIRYKESLVNNVENFETNLRQLYENSFVEIVGESVFAQTASNLSEKTLHTFHAANFPIILAPAGSVAHLRNTGFDMFDDVVDHSYDTIVNPFQRIITAIDSNIKLLTDVEKTKQLWKANQHRFISNNKFAKKDMYENYAANGIQKLKSLLNEQK